MSEIPTGVMIEDPVELMDEVISVWSRLDRPTETWLQSMPKEVRTNLGEALLGAFLVIRKQSVKKEAIATWMKSVDDRLDGIYKILQESGNTPDPTPDP